MTSQQNNFYPALVALTAVAYDYVLMFSDEVEYIWTKPWTRLTILFTLARYVGLCIIIIVVLWGSSFLPSATYEFMLPPGFGNMILVTGGVFFKFITWAISVFCGAADVIMILRVWALYNRSRIVLGTLLTLYAMVAIPYLIQCILTTQKVAMAAQDAEVLYFMSCVYQFDFRVLSDIVSAAHIALDGSMCLLVCIRFVWESLQMYKVTKQFRLNHYINVIAREGIFYFFADLGLPLVNLLVTPTYSSQNELQVIALAILEYIPSFILVPRFVLGLRKLHMDRLRGRRGSEIDAAFGFSSVATVRTNMFAEDEPIDPSERDEETQVGQRET